MTQEEFLEKMDSEGGISDGFSYGLRPDDLSPDVDLDFYTAVATAYIAWQMFQDASTDLEEWF